MMEGREREDERKKIMLKSVCVCCTNSRLFQSTMIGKPKLQVTAMEGVKLHDGG